MIPYKQLSLADIFTDCQNKFDNDKDSFLTLLDETINLDEIVPASFASHFHAATGRPRRHLLYKMGVLILVTLVVQIPHAKRQGGFIPPAVYATYTRPLFFWMTCTAFAGKFFLSCP